MKLHSHPHHPPYCHHRWTVHLQLWNTQLEVVNLVEGWRVVVRWEEEEG